MIVAGRGFIVLVETKYPGWIIWPVSLKSWEKTGNQWLWLPGGQKGHFQTADSNWGAARGINGMVLEQESVQEMEAGGRPAKPVLQKPLATANSACTSLAPFSTPYGSCAWEA